MRDSNERGAALISILLLLIIMSALSAALTISTRTEVAVSKNRHSAAQARAAAEAGLNHAAEVVIANLANWQAGGFATPSDAMSRLLRGPDDLTGTTARDADNGSLETLGIPRPPARLGLNNVPNVGYEARVFDEDDPARGTTLTLADRNAIGEQAVANAYADLNSILLVRAVGFASDGTSLTLEATVTREVLPAILCDGDLTISGNPTVNGSAGSVHANEDLSISGNPTVAQDATASGTYSTSGNPTVGGLAAGGQPLITVPPVRAIDYRPLADFVLTDTGRLTTLGGAVLCNASVNNDACKALYGWIYDGANGWKISDNNMPPLAYRTFYAETAIKVSSSPGSPANPWLITIIAEGSIDISGNPDVRPETPGILFVTDGDLEISGGLDMVPGFEGQILVHEQIKLNGNPTIYGNIVVEDAPSVSNLVTENRISGNATVTYNGGGGGATFTIGAWREVR